MTVRSDVEERQPLMEAKVSANGILSFGTFDGIRHMGYKKQHSKDMRPPKSTIRRSELKKFICRRNICMKVKEGDDIVEKTTNCYGEIEFKETTNRSTGKFIRFSDDTEPGHLFELLTQQWDVEPPRLLISVTGGRKIPNIPLSLKNDFQHGLSNIANTPGAWVISGGTNTGVMKMVGDANFNLGMKNICIGIAPWGTVAKRETLDRQHVSAETQQDPDVFPYRLGSHLIETGIFLDANHSHFLLVDNGSDNTFAKEIEFRGRFEQYIMTYVKGCGETRIPTVLLVFEGGTGTLTTILNNAVLNNVPCVLIEGSRGTADLLVYAVRNCQQIKECKEVKHEGLVEEVRKIKQKFTDEELSKYYDIVLKCLEKVNAFTIANFESGMDTDDAVLTALLKNPSMKLSHYEQLQLAILWDRADLARTKILSPMCEWKPMNGCDGKTELYRLMIMALALKRTSFVRVLLEYGVSINSLLTKQVLEFLYWYSSSPLIRVDIKSQPVDPQEDEDGFLQSLLSYSDNTRRENVVKRMPLQEVQKRLLEVLNTLPRSHVENVLEIPKDSFVHPFRQLFLWAVLNNLLDMALLFWDFADDGIALALLATEITNGLINDSRFSLLGDDKERMIKNCLITFSRLSFELLDECYKNCETAAGLLVSERLDLFNGRASCVEFAFLTKQSEFVGHNAIQAILTSIWYGSIKSCDTHAIKVCATIFCPLFLIDMNIQSQEQFSKLVGCDGKVAIDHDDEDLEYDNPLTAMQEDGPGLSFAQKFYNFHVHSPLVKFIEHTLGYLLFLITFSCVAMCEITTTTPGPWESLVIVTVIALFFGEVYQIIHQDGSASAKVRLEGYFWDVWNLFDCLCIIVFVIAVILRCFESSMDKGQLFYAVDVSLWWVRLLQIMYVHPVTGPYVVMIRHMLSDMFSFLMILLIFILSYGVAWHAILQPGQVDTQMLVQSIFKPFFNIYGEFFIDEPDDNKKTWFGTVKRNDYAEPIAFVYMAIYLLIANVLLLNLLIAIFGNTFGNVMASASLIWKFQRFSLIMEYSEHRSFLCPPFSLLTHIPFFIRWVVSMCVSCVPAPKIRGGFQPPQAFGRSTRKLFHELQNLCSIQVARRRKERLE